mmetsp:Transcript_6718/g.24779  ORF Transcript_6718/g.24779 Transcript_6718/m.24779 type:complete len:206 (-) Transcript_6718:276-893(-)
MSALASAPLFASARISSRNFTMRSSAGARVSSLPAPPPAPASPPPASPPTSPKPTAPPPPASATPSVLKMVVTNCAAADTISGRTSSFAVFPKYAFVALTSSFNALITAGVLTLSIIAACVAARATSTASDKARSFSFHVCARFASYPPGPELRNTPFTAWKNSANVFSAITAASICLNPTHGAFPDASTASPNAGVKSMGSLHW